MSKLLQIAFALSAVASAGEFLPLETGNFWVYRDAQSGHMFTMRVGTPVWLQSGRIYHSLSGYAPGQLLARINEDGHLVAYDEESESERTLTAFTAREGDWWPAPNRECALEGQADRNRSEYAGPAGRYNKTLGVQYRSVSCADAGPTAEQYAENIGLLRRDVTTIAGPRRYDLIYARIGNMTIENRDRGRFTVSVDQPAGKDVWLVTLRLDLGFAPSLPLRFPTAQEFDVAIRDAGGNVVWTWSDGKVFAQSAQQKSLGNLWSVVVEVPRPAAAEGYTVEGWLTTAPGEAKVAATAPAPPLSGNR
jgi:hypothetical protein